MAQGLTNPTRIPKDVGLVPGLAQWVKDLVWHELWCRSQTRLGSGVAVAVMQASSYSSSSTPRLGTSTWCRCGPKKQKKKKKARRPEQMFFQRKHIDGQRAHEKMPNIANHQRTANQHHIEICHFTPVSMAITKVHFPGEYLNLFCKYFCQVEKQKSKCTFFFFFSIFFFYFFKATLAAYGSSQVRG